MRIAGLWSHLADASPEDDAAALAEFQAAVAVAAGLGVEKPFLHLAASSAGIREPEARFDQVRFGIAAYGISPFDDVDGRGLGLRPVMTYRAPVIAVAEGRATIAAGAPTASRPRCSGRPDPVPGCCSTACAARWSPSTSTPSTSPWMRPTVTVAATIGDIATVFGPGDDGEPTAEEWASWAEHGRRRARGAGVDARRAGR